MDEKDSLADRDIVRVDRLFVLWATLSLVVPGLIGVGVGVLGARNASHFAGPPCDYEGWDYAGTADGGLAQLDEA